jgi:hypothetical protein
MNVFLNELEIAVSNSDYKMTLQFILEGIPVEEQLVYDAITIHNWGFEKYAAHPDKPWDYEKLSECAKKIAPLLIQAISGNYKL